MGKRQGWEVLARQGMRSIAAHGGATWGVTPAGGLVELRPDGAQAVVRERDITVGEPFEVVDKQPFDGPVFVRFGGGTHAFGGALARAMRVEVVA